MTSSNGELSNYEVVLLQFRPVVDSEERVNVGAFMYSPSLRQLRWRISERYGRLTELFPELTGAGYRAMVRHLRERATSILRPSSSRQALLLEQSLAEVLPNVLPRNASNFTWSTTRMGVLSDPDERFEELYYEFVGRYEEPTGRPRIDDKILWENVTTHEVFTLIEPFVEEGVRLVTSDYEYVFRAGWMNGQRQVVEPVSFDYARPGDMVEAANKWRGRLEELQRENEFVMTAIVTDPPSQGSLKQYERANAILERAPQVRRVFRQSQIGLFAALVLDDLSHSLPPPHELAVAASRVGFLTEPVSDERLGADLAPWTRDELMAFWRQLAPHARRLIGELATKPEGYAYDELQKVMGVSGLSIGGRFSSVGHVARRFSHKPSIIRRDYARRLYSMDLEVARVLREVASGSE